MKRLLLLVTVLAVLVSCQKEVGFDPVTGGGGGGTGGGGTGGGGGTTDTYQPVTKDSYWKYKDSALGGYITTMTCTGQKKTIDNRVFDVFNSETTGQPSFEGYFFVKKPEYGMRAPITGGVGTLDYIYLNETAAVGNTWTNAMGPIGGYPSRFTGTIVEKNISKTVAGKNFTNVIHTNLVLEYELPFFGWTEVGNYEYFIAKNIGIIRIESDLGFGGATARTVLDLIDYSIK